METHGYSKRTAFDIVMMALSAELVKAGQPVEADGLELVKRDSPISVLVQAFKHRADNVLGLLLVFNVILRAYPELSTRAESAGGLGTHLGLLLGINVMDTVNSLNLLLVPAIIATASVGAGSKGSDRMRRTGSSHGAGRSWAHRMSRCGGSSVSRSGFMEYHVAHVMLRGHL